MDVLILALRVSGGFNRRVGLNGRVGGEGGGEGEGGVDILKEKSKERIVRKEIRGFFQRCFLRKGGN